MLQLKNSYKIMSIDKCYRGSLIRWNYKYSWTPKLSSYIFYESNAIIQNQVMSQPKLEDKDTFGR